MREPRLGLALVLLAIAAIWLLAASRWIVTDTVVPWDAKNQFYAFFRFLATAIHSRPRAVLESLSLRRASERRRSAIADLLAAVRAVGAVRSGAVDPRVRSHRLRALGCRRAGRRRARLARGLAGVGLDPGGGDLHVRRTGLGPAAAHRHHPELRPFPGRAAADAGGAAAPLDARSRAPSAWWRPCSRWAATTRPCCCASSSPPRSRARSSRPSDRRRYLRERRARAGDDGRSSRLRCWRCRCC